MTPDTWVESDNADNDVATASHAAVAGKRHVATSVTASFSAASVVKLLTITCTIEGTSTTITHYVHNAEVIPLNLRGDVNTLISAALAASGAGGTVGRVNLTGYTIG